MRVPNSEFDALLDPILAVFQADFSTQLGEHYIDSYLQGSAEMVEWGRTKFTDRPIFFEGPPMEQAVDHAKRHGAQLVTKMNEETKRRLAGVISRGIDNKRGIDGLARDIRTAFDNMSKYRSRMISRTETNEALEQAFMDRSHDLGVTGKEWIVNNPCEICKPNGESPPIKIDAEFPSGHVRPPVHPNCDCALAPVMLGEPEAKGLKGDDWVGGMSEAEHKSVSSWIEGDFKGIRKYQQTGKGSQRVIRNNKALESALDKSAKYEGKVYRGLNSLNEKQLKAITNAETLEWNAVTSGTKSPGLAERFAQSHVPGRNQNVVFEIKSKTGVDLDPVARTLKGITGEKEVLMRAKSQYRVVSVSKPNIKINSATGWSRHLTRIVLEEI
ncbi:hypothetical protein LCGC14_2192100 [marine sediment metagenome]|uniref:Phage head morphogenesis domain-containing protein n=1 Tax=marine sediment metagenome TaxID=412755 RepID=A0A0F9DJG0_9ZZZZ